MKRGLSHIKIELNSPSRLPAFSCSRARLNRQSDDDAVSRRRLKSISGAAFRKSREETRARDEISKLF